MDRLNLSLRACVRLNSLALMVLLVFIPPAVLAQPTTDVSNKTNGWWKNASDAGTYDWNVKAVHMVLMRGSTDPTYGSHSRVLVYNGGTDESKVWLWNSDDSGSGLPQASQLHQVLTNSSGIFCSGHSGLPDGRVLVTGGNELPGPGIDHVNIFQATSNLTTSWVSPRPPNMVESRWYPSNTVLGNGKTLVLSGEKYKEMTSFGGVNASGVAVQDVHAFGMRGVPIHGAPSYTNTPGTGLTRQEHSAIFDAANSGCGDEGYASRQRMLVYGGYVSAYTSPLSDVWDIRRDRFGDWTANALSPGGTPPPARSGHTAVYYPTTKSMIIFGGRDASGVLLDDVWQLPLPVSGSCNWSGSWSSLSPTGGDASLKRHNHTAIWDAANSRILVFGGVNSSGVNGDVWQLTLGPSPAWTKLTPTGSINPREGHIAAYDSGRQRMVIFGGRNGATRYQDLHAFATNTWTNINPTGTLPPARDEAAGIYDVEGQRIIVYGGETSGGVQSDVWDLFFHFTDEWTQRSPVLATVPRSHHTAIYDDRRQIATIPELFDNSGGGSPWSALGSAAENFMPLYPLMFLLPDGKLANTGPDHQGEKLDVDNPTTPWTTFAGSTGFSAGTAVMYEPGKVMKCGSEDGVGVDFWTKCDIGGGGNWTTNADMGQERTKHNLTILADGTVLMSGGLSEWPQNPPSYESLVADYARRSVQIWNPATNTWTGNLAQDPAVREYHSTATLLPDGKVLSGGGEYNTNPDRRYASVYWPPYLFDAAGAVATRPTIGCADATIGYGGKFLVQTAQAGSIDLNKVALIKPGAVTHQFNQDQRYIKASAVRYGSTDYLICDSPPTANHAPPGDYMLFILNTSGVPAVSRWVRVSPDVKYATGTQVSATWSGTTVCTDDVTIPSGAAITVSAGSKVVFMPGKRLIVEGTLTVSGSIAQPVTFQANECNLTEGAWFGIDVRAGATARIVRADIRHAVYGVYIQNPDSARVSYSTLASNQNYDIWIDGVNSNPTKILINNNTITVGGGSGILFKRSGGGGTISSNSVTGSASSPITTSGMVIGEDTDAGVTITENTITGCGGGDGIKLEISGTSIIPTVTKNTIQNNKYGIRSLKGGVLIGTTATDSDNFLNGGNTHAIWVQGGEPKVRNNRINSNTYGVTKKSSGSPNLGTIVPDDPGKNNLSGNSTYCIWNQTSVGISAVGNYFGDCDVSGDPPICWNGLILNTDHLCLAPASARRPAVEQVPAAENRILRIQPNPALRLDIQVDVELARTNRRVELYLFDVSGRRIANRVLEGVPQGRQTISWDLQELDDSKSPAGVYFLRAIFDGGTTSTAKFLLTR